MKPTFYSGLLFLAVGLLFSAGATSYTMGTASNMGPGYFPFMLGIILAVLGVLNLIKSIASKEITVPVDIAWRPLIMILLANILFGVLLPYMGLVIAIFVLVVVASVAMPATPIKETIALATVLSVVGCVVFVWALGMPLPVLPGV